MNNNRLTVALAPKTTGSPSAKPLAQDTPASNEKQGRLSWYKCCNPVSITLQSVKVMQLFTVVVRGILFLIPYTILNT